MAAVIRATAVAAAAAAGVVAGAVLPAFPRVARGKGTALALRCLGLWSREVFAPPIPDGLGLVACLCVRGLRVFLLPSVSVRCFPGVAARLGALAGDDWAVFVLLQAVHRIIWPFPVSTRSGV